MCEICGYVQNSTVNCLNHQFESFFGIESHVALDRNLGPGYNTLLLQLNPGEINCACPHGQFHTQFLPALNTVGLHCQTLTPDNACIPCRKAVCRPTIL